MARKNTFYLSSQHLTKSVSNPFAQSNGSCENNLKENLTKNENILRDILKSNTAISFKAITTLMATYGLRVSECLSIKSTDITSDGIIYIKGSKGSNDRLIVPVYFKEFFINLPSGNAPLSSIFSRFWLYREMKKYGFYNYFGNNEHASVTHYLRHIRILNLKNSNISRENISKFIGHKSLKSIEYYEKSGRL